MTEVDEATPLTVSGGLTPEDLTEILQRYRTHLIGLAGNVLGDRAAAQDAVQDAVEAILRRQPVLADERSAVAYARTAVINCSRTALRRKASRRRLLVKHGVDAHAPGADEPVLLRDEHRRVLRHFDRLPARQREVLTLRHFSHLSDADIAAALRISESAVRSNASRGLKTLGRYLKGDES